MVRRRWEIVAITAILFFSLILGGSVHAFIAHDHGGHHHEAESSIWQSLHQSLRHEDKKAVVLLDQLYVVGVVLIIIRLFAPRRLTSVVDSTTRALRRGVFAYRKFG